MDTSHNLDWDSQQEANWEAIANNAHSWDLPSKSWAKSKKPLEGNSVKTLMAQSQIWINNPGEKKLINTF